MNERRFRRFVNRATHLTLYFLAGVLVFCAVVFTATRAMTPFLTLHKQRFERWGEKITGMPLKVSKVTLGWNGIEPEMWLQDVTLYSANDKKQKIAKVENFYVSLNLVRSLFAREIVLGVVTFSGAHFDVKQLNGGYEINNAIKVSLDEKSGSSLGVFFKNILRRAFVNLRNITIDYEPLNHQALNFNLKTLSLNGHDKAYDLYGDVVANRPKVNSPFEINFILENEAGLFDFKQATGKLYARVEHLDLRSWFKTHKYHGYWFNAGSLSTQLWSRFKNGHIDYLGLKPTLYNLKLHSEVSGQWLNIKSLTGTFAANQSKKDWRLSVNQLNVITQDSVWPTLNFYVENNENDKRLSMWINYLDLRDTLRWLSGSTILPLKLNHMLKQYQPSGAIQNAAAFVNTQNHQQFYLDADLGHLSVKNIPGFGGVSQISGHVLAVPGRGVFDLNSQDVTLNVSHLFTHPFNLSKTTGRIRWHYSPGAFKITGENLSLANQDIYWTGSFGLMHQPKMPTELSLLGGFYVYSPTVAGNYLPTKIMDKGAVKWLDQAFISGDPLEGKILIHGPVADFPFEDHRGIFQVDAKIRNMNLHYADDWPDIIGLNANLLFADNTMTVSADGGHILGASLSKLNATIPSLAGFSPDRLLVKAKIDDSAGDVLRFFHDTPLKDTLGESVQNMQMQGQTSTELDLNIPFNDPDKTVVKGKTSLQSVDLHLLDWRLWLKALSGSINFTESGISAKKITGELLGQPISIQMNSVKRPVPSTAVTFTSLANIDDIFEYFGKKQPPYIQGRFPFLATLSLPDKLDATHKNHLLVRSDLKGVAISLPAPFAKTSAQAVPVNFDVSFAGTDPGNINFNYGQLLSGAFSFLPSQNGASLYSGHLSFGVDKTFAPVKQEFLVTGHVDQFSWQTWQPVYHYFMSDVASDHQNLNSAWLQKFKPDINIDFGQLVLPSITLLNTRLSALREDKAWRYGIDNQNLRATLDYPDQYPKAALTANIAYLNLTPFLKAGKAAEPADFPLSEFPWVNLSVGRLVYNTLSLQNLSLDLKPDAEGLALNNIKLASPLLSGDFSGRVDYKQGKPAQSHFRGSLASSDLRALLASLGVKSSVTASQSNMTFDLSWPGFLTAFDLSRLTGDANLKLSDGWIVDLGKSATQKLNMGKLLTLLSVNHLLTLDMKSLGHDGYHFDSLTAALNFSGGKVSSTNIQALGQVADIKAKGWVDLIKQTLDLNVGVDANLGASLPVIAAIAGGPILGPIAGIATWAVDKIVHNETRKSSRYDYHLFGPWSHIKVETLKAESKS